MITNDNLSCSALVVTFEGAAPEYF